MATCKWCEADNAEGAATCANCGQPLAADSAFDAQAFAGAMSAKIDEQIAARMAESGGPPVAGESAPAAPVVPVAAAPMTPPPQPQQAYPAPAPPQQYAPPAPPQQAYPPPGQPYIPPGYTAAPMQQPKSGLGNAIAVTILCCMPLGAVAIVYATQVDKKWAMGDYAGAQHAAKMANLWATIGAVIGIIWILIAGIIGFMNGMNSTTTYTY